MMPEIGENAYLKQKLNTLQLHQAPKKLRIALLYLVKIRPGLIYERIITYSAYCSFKKKKT